MAFKTAKARKSLTYSIIILLIISLSLLSYFYYFIPANRKTIHKNGFLILQTIAANITESINSRMTLDTNFYNNAVSKNNALDEGARKQRQQTITALLKENNIDARVMISALPLDTRGLDTTEIRVEEGKLMVSLFSSALREKVTFTEPLHRLLDPILSIQKSELFQSYLLGKMTGNKTELLYHDQELALRSDRGIDSLLPKGEAAFLTGIRDLNLYDVNRKVFYYPFRVQQAQLVIGGLVESKEYNMALRKLPFYFIYSLAVVFLLLLVSLPIIKFHVMDPNEQVRMSDVFLFGLSVFVGASLLTLFIIHFCLWKGEEKRVFQNLATLSGQVKASFNQEIQAAYRQLAYLDSCKNSQGFSKDYSQDVRQMVTKLSKDTARYFYFDRVSWIDSAGQQRIKADLYAQPVFTNVSARQYFQVFKKGVPYSLPGNPEKKMGFEPIYSRTNADFNIIISKEDTAAGGFIVAMAMKMNSVVQTILPAGYGFCIVDEQGNVQLHADINRNLNENFFQKIDPAGDIKSAVATRQLKQVNGVAVYGKVHQMLVQPLDNLPFSLITFYDKGYIVPVNMRLLIFALSFCFLFAVICLVLWFALTKRYTHTHRFIYCPMDAVSWLIPKRTEATFYFHAFLYILFYIIALLSYVFLNHHYAIGNFNILGSLLITPFNIGLGLYVIRSVLVRPVKEITGKGLWKNRKDVLINSTLHLAISLLIFFSLKDKCSITGVFLVYQLTINAILWIYAVSKEASPLFLLGKRAFTSLAGKSFPESSDYLVRYNLLAISLVIALAVLPSALFTWYAHNQELMQSVKRAQLHLANAIYDRSVAMQEWKGMNDASMPVPGFYLDSLRFSKGIYKIYSDSIVYGADTPASRKATALFEEFYFAVADKISTPYYRQQPYAVLVDKAYDNSWRWQMDPPLMRFAYHRALPALGTASHTAKDKSLLIFSMLPARFIFLGSVMGIITVLGLAALLLWGLYKWLKVNSRQIFLVRYIDAGKAVYNKNSSAAAGQSDKPAAPVQANSLVSNQPLYNKAYDHDWGKLYNNEKAIIEDIHVNKEYYNEKWNNCSEKEKSLLYNIARDGLLNYKNTADIMELMRKGLLVIDCERVRLFHPGFRAFILYTCVDGNADMNRIQKMYLENSTWQSYRVPLLILLVGIAALLFFTQQGVFDKLLLLAGGISTLTTLVMRFMGGGGKEVGPGK